VRRPRRNEARGCVQPHRQTRRRLRRGHDAVGRDRHRLPGGIDEGVVGRVHQDRFDGLAVVRGLVMAHVALRQHVVIGHRKPDQRRAGARRVEGTEAGADAGAVQALDDLGHAGCRLS